MQTKTNELQLPLWYKQQDARTGGKDVQSSTCFA